MSLHHGDCLEVMAGMEPESVDAIVTDPPYGLEFMGKEWDRLGDIGKTSHAGPAPIPTASSRRSGACPIPARRTSSVGPAGSGNGTTLAGSANARSPSSQT